MPFRPLGCSSFACLNVSEERPLQSCFSTLREFQVRCEKGQCPCHSFREPQTGQIRSTVCLGPQEPTVGQACHLQTAPRGEAAGRALLLRSSRLFLIPHLPSYWNPWTISKVPIKLILTVWLIFFGDSLEGQGLGVPFSAIFADIALLYIGGFFCFCLF